MQNRSARYAVWVCCAPLWAWAQADEDAALRREAAAFAAEGAPAVAASAPPAANALNPEVSATVDMTTAWRAPEEGDPHVDFALRSVEVDLQSALDPQSRFRMILAAHGDHVALEEGHVTWSGLAPGISVVGGRFRQALGTVNRWHDHGLDQLDRPLALRGMLGAEGLSQTGLSVSWLAGGAAATSTLTLEVTNAESGALFPGAERPAALLAWAGHFPLGESSYAEVQIAGMHGEHRGGAIVDDGHGHEEAEHEDEAPGGPSRATDLASLTFDLGYDPPGGRDRVRLFWRSQALYLTREEAHERSHQLGAFTYVDAWLDGAWVFTTRFDVLGEAGHDLGLGEATYGVAPAVSWWQSEFVRLRLQYRVEGHHGLEHLIALQVVGAVGPHRHERY